MINLVDAVDLDGWYYAGYYVNYGYEQNYDVYDVSGWVRTLVIRALIWIPCFRTTKIHDQMFRYLLILEKVKFGKTRIVESQ